MRGAGSASLQVKAAADAAVSDDPGNKRLTLFTVEVPLTEMVTNGAATVSANSVARFLANSDSTAPVRVTSCWKVSTETAKPLI